MFPKKGVSGKGVLKGLGHDGLVTCGAPSVTLSRAAAVGDLGALGSAPLQ
ncbi:MAG: hypothetical protein JSU73_03250 [candidate division WOR-3 bacterium]|nr:MAG: hypothetical protein JSU73_03250 [candidate division WOR-3 bacterium]